MRKINFKNLAGATAIATTLPAAAFAGTGGTMPWDSTLNFIMQDLTGTVAHIVLVICVVFVGLVWATGKHEQGVKWGMGVVVGGAIAEGAASLLSDLGLSSGATIGGNSSILPALIAIPAGLLVAKLGISLCNKAMSAFAKAKNAELEIPAISGIGA